MGWVVADFLKLITTIVNALSIFARATSYY